MCPGRGSRTVDLTFSFLFSSSLSTFLTLCPEYRAFVAPFSSPSDPSFLFYLDLPRLHDFHRVRESRIHMATYPSFFLFSFSFLPIEGIVQLGKFFFYPISGNSSEIPYDTIRVNRFNLKFFYLSRLIIDTNRNTIFQLFVRIIE